MIPAITNQTRLKRLRKLLHLMENYDDYFRVEKINFDMSDWFRGSLRHGCGTTCCALGAAALLPEFKRKGLRLVPRPGEFLGAYVEYNGHSWWAAGQYFFGITLHESRDLFDGTTYKIGWDRTKPRHVAKKIKQLILSYERSSNATA